MIIALDGPSGTGKSTLAKLLASSLNFKMLNTGMIYRAITYYFYNLGIFSDNTMEIIKRIKELKIEIIFDNQNQNVHIDGIDITPYVSNPEVQQNVSLYSSILEIRQFVTKIQREYAKTNNVIIEGRDIGTEVFPNADIKFYVTCDTTVRAKRRLADLQKLNQSISLDEVIDSLEKRDYLDKTRKYGPLRRADDAIDIDTSNSTIDESLNEMLGCIKTTKQTK